MANRIDDAGHGGSDPGAVKNDQQEKVWTLEAAKYVNARLKELGIDSAMTRTSDVTLSQNERTNKVKKHAKCISHHYNAGGGAGVEFIHSIYSDGKFEKLLEEEFKKAGYPVRRTFTRMLASGKDYYYMHRDTGATRTTIVEYDFLDGPNFPKLKDKSYREGMYECVVKAVCRDEGVKYVAPEEKKKAEPKKEQVKSETIEKPKANLKVDGYWGPLTTKALQLYLGTPADSIISGQYNTATTRQISGVHYGKGGSTVIRALQKLIGAKVDGLIGPETVRKLQQYLGTRVDGVISRPSTMVKGLQRRLNKGNL
ncbi:hypothetical protein GMD78_12360 [Ornithinibacillus sp. L9]|uniref:MurNAc-LAA domain-containing protein n=1 Tax=Ornithinibacillus caprae TaxID=2678566 RepID=A0A6N8FKC5_9BACI|nr:N-acetylmuramoyl-L-alanine amidase [Ornithinibacillus caprae]MUK89166.1 hypothetical protein [Ornithinibacillus caprae]